MAASVLATHTCLRHILGEESVGLWKEDMPGKTEVAGMAAKAGLDMDQLDILRLSLLPLY